MAPSGGPDDTAWPSRHRRIIGVCILVAAVTIAVVGLISGGGGTAPSPIRILVTTSADQALRAAGGNDVNQVILVASSAPQPDEPELFIQYKVRAGETREQIAAALGINPDAVADHPFKDGELLHVPLPPRFTRGTGKDGPVFTAYTPPAASSTAGVSLLGVPAADVPRLAEVGARLLVAVGPGARPDVHKVAEALPDTVEAIGDDHKVLVPASVHDGTHGPGRIGTALRWLLIFAVGLAVVPLAGFIHAVTGRGTYPEPTSPRDFRPADFRPADFRPADFRPARYPRPAPPADFPPAASQRPLPPRRPAPPGPGAAIHPIGVEVIDRRTLLEDPQCSCGSVQVDASYACRACPNSWRVGAGEPWPDILPTNPADDPPGALSADDHLPPY
ncbi:hypothetical protein [Frankia sp. CgMI4]|uniref:hypothetical protein n=1 Tax=Frankia sp. CgMI4 TaxID=1742262 RepID=UPI0015863FAB|nr:hypothetical protein [Frankia sp. CgIM4]